MTLEELPAEIQRAGLHVTENGHALNVEPRDRVTPTLAAAFAEHKSALLARLHAPPLAVPSRTPIIVPATTITPRELEWLWPRRLAVGALTLLVGLPDQGKSLAFIDLTARTTKGAPLPPEQRLADGREPGRVLILTLEDDLSTTITPRLLKAEADLTRVDFLQMVRDAEGRTSFVTLADDLKALEYALRAGAYRLVVVDGITGYLGDDPKSHADANVRNVLVPFAQLLAHTGVAGLGVMHPPKQVTNLAYYASGSIAWTAVARVVLGAAKDPDDETENPRRLLLKLKGNLYGHVPTLAYRITAESDAGVAWLEWELDPVEIDVADVLAPPPADKLGKQKRCEAFLEAYLAAGPTHGVKVEQAAKEMGFSAITIRRARETVCDTNNKPGLGGWVWSLKQQRQQPPTRERDQVPLT